MILRKLAEAIRRQDWFTVVVEVLIVVIGIFIGLQVDDWNQLRKGRILEREYLERLFSDLNGSIEDFVYYSNWDLRRLERQYVVLQSLRSGVLREEDRAGFADGLAMAGIHNPPRRRWGTVEELISTGNISLISDVKFRSALLASDSHYTRNERIARAAEDRIATLRPDVTRRVDIRAFNLNFLGQADVAFDFDALAADRALVGTLADIQVASDMILEFSVDSTRNIERLRDQLADILGVDTEGLPTVDIDTQAFLWRTKNADE